MNALAISLSGLTFHPNPAEYDDQHLPVQWIKPMFSPQVYYGSYVSNFNSQFDKMKDLPYEATKSSQTPTTLTDQFYYSAKYKLILRVTSNQEYSSRLTSLHSS